MNKYATKPLLTVNDEEYKMLLEASEEFEKQKTDKTARENFGTAPEIVLRNHLLERKLNLSLNPDVIIEGSKIKNGLLLLKNGVDPNQKSYAPDNVKIVIDVKNNSPGCKELKNGKREDPNKALRLKFNELEALTNVKNYAVVVFSETLLPPKGPFKWRYKEEAIVKQNCKVFTLVARQVYPSGGLYLKSNLEEMLQNGQMKKTEEIEKLIRYLQNI
jgi:hypothetical protein